MQSSETKVTSYRISPEVKEQLQRLMGERQISTNQLFEELILLANRQGPDIVVTEENEALESALNQILGLFNERALRIELQKKENNRIKSRHLNTIQELEKDMALELERIQVDYQQKINQSEEARSQLERKAEEAMTLKEIAQSELETERASFNESIKNHKKTIFELEGKLKQMESERDQLYRQSQSLVDRVDELKEQSRRLDGLEEENQKLYLEVKLLHREKEIFESQLNEQIELAILREREKWRDEQ